MRAALVALGSLIGFACAGCGGGPELTPATGKVMYRNAPLTSGLVMFQPTSGQPARGEIQPDGTFVLGTFGERDGATVGPNQVRVVARQKPMITDAAQGEVGAGELVIPERFANYGTSGLTVEIERGRTEPYLIELMDE